MAEDWPVFAVGGPVVEYLDHAYRTKLRDIAENDAELRKTMPGMLVAPDGMTVYLGDTHLAIEHFGPANVPTKSIEGVKVSFFDYRGDGDFISNIIGMKFHATGPRIALAPSDLYWNLFVPTSTDAVELMMEIGWDLTAENMAFMMNSGGISLPDGQFARMVNCFFYGKENERLRTRRIQWIDFFPLTYEPVDADNSNVEVRLWPDMDHTVDHDAHMQFPRPSLFENERLGLLNRFRELILTPGISEPKITRWLAQPAHQFILRMALPAVGLLAQKKCKWMNEPSREPIIPDFFAVKPNGFADIVEFKLPELKGDATVGKVNRESFSAEVNSYVAQTHCYKEYFEDSSNRKHLKTRYGGPSPVPFQI
jgi:hypothetical protein